MTNPETAKLVAGIIDPHSFVDIPFTDDPTLLEMVEQSKRDALRKAERIIAALGASEAAKLIEAISKVRDGYASQMQFCDIEALGYFREFVRRIDAALTGAGR